MSRFPEASVACLKRVMLARAPEFSFLPADVTAIMLETGLNQSQIRVWGDHFRMRYATEKERMDFLSSDGSDKDAYIKVSRYFITAFNVNPDFAAVFRFPKSKGQGEFNIKYMEAAFDKEAESGEFFVEFEEKVWEHKLIKSFHSQGANQVMTSTFANLDANESAAAAMLRVIYSQEKTNLKYSRGTCSPALLAKVQAKQAAAKEQSSSKEFDEKTMAAIKQSMALQEETKAAVVKVEGSLQSVQDGMQSQVVKLEGIQQGVCNVIPDYQREIEQLKQKLAHKTAMCDRIEGQKGRLTYEINKLKSELEESRLDKVSLHQEKNLHIKTIQTLQEQVDICKGIAILKQMMEETQHTAEVLASTLADERASKRQRGV